MIISVISVLLNLWFFFFFVLIRFIRQIRVTIQYWRVATTVYLIDKKLPDRSMVYN